MLLGHENVPRVLCARRTRELETCFFKLAIYILYIFPVYLHACSVRSTCTLAPPFQVLVYNTSPPMRSFSFPCFVQHTIHVLLQETPQLVTMGMDAAIIAIVLVCTLKGAFATVKVGTPSCNIKVYKTLRCGALRRVKKPPTRLLGCLFCIYLVCAFFRSNHI